MSKITNAKMTPTKKGDVKVLIQTAEADIWLSVPQYKSKGCSATVENYNGGTIDVDYYAVGEELFGSTPEKPSICNKANTIVRDFTISANPEVLAHALAIESASKMQVASDKALMFARARKVAREKAEADALVATKSAPETVVG